MLFVVGYVDLCTESDPWYSCNINQFKPPSMVVYFFETVRYKISNIWIYTNFTQIKHQSDSKFFSKRYNYQRRKLIGRLIVMNEIAFKSKLSNIMLFFGAILFVLFSFLTVTIKPNGWILYFLLSVVMVIIFIGGFCYEVKRPNCLIKLSNGFLWIYTKRKWDIIHVTDMITINYRKTKSRRMVLNSGTLKITTKDSSYTLSNVKDVEVVEFMLRKIKQKE